MVGSTDEELMSRFQQGDEAAFDQLVGRYGPAVKGFAARVTTRPEEAEDIHVETFVRVVESAHRWKRTGSFRSYLFTIAWRLCLDSCRRQSVQRRALRSLRHEPATPPVSPESQAASAQKAQQLEQGLAELSEHHRAAVLLTYRSDLNSTEVGEILGLSAQEVRSRLTYARQLLRQHLEVEGTTDA